MNPNNYFSYLLVGVRLSTLFSQLPLISETTIPTRIRLMLVIAMTIFYEHHLNTTNLALESYGLETVFLEATIGIILGFLAKCLFEAMVLAAHSVSTSMGFHASNVLAPGSDNHMSPFSVLHRSFCILTILSLNLHLPILESIQKSWDFIPFGSLPHLDKSYKTFLKISSGMFFSALQMASPLFLGLTFSTLTLGIMSRSSSQLNIFSLSFPVNFFLGIWIYISLLSFLSPWLSQEISKILTTWISFWS